MSGLFFSCCNPPIFSSFETIKFSWIFVSAGYLKAINIFNRIKVGKYYNHFLSRPKVCPVAKFVMCPTITFWILTINKYISTLWVAFPIPKTLIFITFQQAKLISSVFKRYMINVLCTTWAFWMVRNFLLRSGLQLQRICCGHFASTKYFYFLKLCCCQSSLLYFLI